MKTGVCTIDVVGLAIDHGVVTKFRSGNEYAKTCPVLKPEEEEGHDSDGEDHHTHADEKHTNHHRDLRKVYRFLDLANAAYKDTPMQDEFPDFVRKSALIRDVKNPSPLLLGLSSTDTEVHVCVLREGSVAFAFRGTEPSRWGKFFEIRDLLTDFAEQQRPVEFYNASDTPCYTAPSSIKAHKGFLLAFRDVTKTSDPKENLLMVVQALTGKEARHIKRVFCVGHSLGGALATLCASWCRYVAFPNAEINCITLGSPRVGNRAFAMDFDQHVSPAGHSYRVVNKGDIVPALPHLLTYPKLSSPYKHVGGLLHFEEDLIKKDFILCKYGGKRSPHIKLQFEHHCCSAYVISLSGVLLRCMEAEAKAKHKRDKALHLI